ncbi:hypothetical protein DFS34DRAFT_593536 [Phlyctochytrium arcticum]|nr:hypothetical protein DFS34DRAFT_593536 [Phlyctochytrium arcticum]
MTSTAKFSPSFEIPSLLASGYGHPLLRTWQSGPISKLTRESLVYPVFVHDKPDEKAEIKTLPGQYRLGINTLVEHFTPLVKKGLKAVILFGVPTAEGVKDDRGTQADSPASPVMQAIGLFRSKFPSVLVVCDLCLCEYTSHGHCGVLNEDGTINNLPSIQRLAEVAANYVRAGCHVIAPSDMMDGRIRAIKEILIQQGLGNKAAVMSYSAKFASGFYGPFRDAAGSAPTFGDRKCYQLPPQARGLARRALIRDVQEGADIVMVKPCLPYLDIVRDAANLCPDHPLAIYQVSGEYAMIYAAVEKGVVDERTAVEEALGGAMRAGANIFITYYAPKILDWIIQDEKAYQH